MKVKKHIIQNSRHTSHSDLKFGNILLSEVNKFLFLSGTACQNQIHELLRSFLGQAANNADYEEA